MIYRLLAALLVASTCQSQQPQPPRPQGAVRRQRPAEQPATPAGKPGSIAGQVVSTTGEPLRKVELSVLPMGPGRGEGMRQITVVSDAQGNFNFAEVPPGSYTLTARRVGYVRYVHSPAGATSRAGVSVAEGQPVTGLTLRLTPQGVVTGRVFDEDGDPLPGAAVQVLSQRYARGSRQMVTVGGGQSNDIGEYRVANLPPGKYYVAVMPRGTGGDWAPGNEVRQTYTQTLYPGVSDVTQASPLEIAAGALVSGIDVRLSKVATVHVRGKVVGAPPPPAGGPGEQMAVTLIPAQRGAASMSARRTARVRPDDFSFDIPQVPAGSYFAIVSQRGRASGRLTGMQAVEVGNQDVDGVVVSLAPAAAITGSIVYEGVVGVSPNAPPAIALEPLHPVFLDRPANAIAKPDGSFAITDLMRTQYRLNIMRLPPGAYLKAARAGAIDVLQHGLDLSGGAAEPLQLLISANAGQVTGSVLGGDAPLSGATVVLIPDQRVRDRHWLFKTATTDQTGAFAIAGIAPGEYTALAFTSIESGAWLDPELLRQVEASGTRVTLAESGTQALQLKAIADPTQGTGR